MPKKEKPKVKILLVEDDPFLLSMYSAKLELEGFNVVSACDGEEGYQKGISERPDLILLDLMLPKMNGFEVLEKIKADPKAKYTPVIMLTNLNQKDDIDRGLKLGAADFLIKAHYMPSEVVAKIKQIIQK